ncbi:unnamed protein product [Soboliphyme baturini]|uniref:PDZ domain-containing protein n=1 Tax=Soboliphyme baturini TaxID=241478 RepID=A0A183J3Y6_9BILA|nr:unnamed protein product [Soboliphyme baturini]
MKVFQIFHGLALLSDNKGSGFPVRLELTRDLLNIQVPIALASFTNTPLLSTDRCVIVKRHPDGGLGFSVKGGESGACKVPVMISKVAETETGTSSDAECLTSFQEPLFLAYTDGPLFVGDVILEVNDTNVEDKTHDEVVQLLKECDQEVKLKVKFQSGMTHLLHRTTSRRRIENNSERSTDVSESELSLLPSISSYDKSTLPKGWSPFMSLPLPMAYITRYLWGTDKLRSNGFEVRTADGTSSGIIYCEDIKIIEHWVHYITSHITALNNQSIKMSNKMLHPDELIVYLGWVCERLNEEQFDTTDFLKTWEPYFLILKGTCAWFFDTPPLSDEDFKNSLMTLKIYETRFKDIKASDRRDKRKHSFMIETASGERHYLSVESSEILQQIRRAWNRCTYYAVTKMRNNMNINCFVQKRTFACVKDERPSGLVIDFLQGIGLYDIPSKVLRTEIGSYISERSMVKYTRAGK